MLTNLLSPIVTPLVTLAQTNLDTALNTAVNAANSAAAQTAMHPDAHLQVSAYVAFIGLVLVVLALDLGVFHREAHEVKLKESITWSVIWVTTGLAFSAVIYFAYANHWLGLGYSTKIYNPASTGAHDLIIRGTVDGATAAKQYLVGYVLEKSLAMDNIFVIALLFTFFAIPSKYQHRVLFWGIIGALIMRGAMIAVGAALIERYQWVLIVFGGFLVVTAIKMAVLKGGDNPGENIVVRMVRKVYPVVDFFDGQHFFTRRTIKPTYSIDPKTGKEVQDPAPAGSLGRWAVTPLFLALIMVEITDLVFAVDSIPAIFAITPDPFIVFTSNIFAILGLRALYFCLAALIAKFRYLKPALIIILAFIGVKLLLFSVPPYLDLIGMTPAKPIKIDTSVSLLVVLSLLGIAVAASAFIKPKPGAEGASKGH